MLTAIIIFCLLFSFLCYRNSLAGAYFIAAFLPSYLIRFQTMGIPMTLLEAMILILFLACLLKQEIKLKEITAHPLFWPLAAFIFFSAVSVIVSPDKIRALGIFKAYFIEPAMFFICLIALVNGKKTLENIFWALGISAAYLCLFSIWQEFSAWKVPQAFLNKDGSVDRVVSVFGYPNALGLYLGPIIVLYTGWLTTNLKLNWQLLVKSGVILLSFVVIVLAKSEGAILAILAILALSAACIKKTRIIALIILAIGFIILFAVEPLRAFVLEKLLLNDWSGIVRKQIWAETWAMLRDNWLWGAGLAGYQIKIVPYHAKWFEIYLYPHNIIMNFWSELGLLGLLSFAWLAVRYFWENVSNFVRATGEILRWNRIISLTLIAVMAEIIIHGLVDAPYFKNDLSVLLMIFLAATVINSSLIKKSQTNK